MLRTADLDYDLPEHLIATHPVEPRDSARLLVVERRDPARLSHRHVRDLPELLDPGDLIVFNTTRVVPARFHGVRAGTGGKVEGLYLHDAGHPASGGGAGEMIWSCLLRAGHTRPGVEVVLHDWHGNDSGVRLVVLGPAPAEPGAWLVRVDLSADARSQIALAGGEEGDLGQDLGSGDVLEHVGATPLPPYILKARHEAGEADDDALDRAAYQTVYAQRESHGGSVAAPTAGLHFTQDLLDRLAARGVRRADVVLHVGAGTFKPVDTEFVEEHPMHREWCAMTREAGELIRQTRAAGRRVIGVGTTSVRTLESYALAVEPPRRAGVEPEFPESIETQLLITPGFAYQWIDGIMTNFHLPRTTLLAMVAALLPGDTDASVGALKRVYAEAIARGYRFYSFGDAMLVR